MAMWRHQLRVPGVALLVTLLAFGGARAAGSAAIANAPPSPETLSVTGFGWGHNRGLSQWGSLGYAVDHGWTYSQILDHYYSNTDAGTSDAETIRVRLTEWDDIGVTVSHPDGITVDGTEIAALAVRVTPTGSGYQIETAPNCSGAWTVAATSA
ncbi:MAG: hypothetical protein GY713_18560, partial [Actinomycetia bacterium]|nr:hypothetical protein [Actinomycetes bacterium]